MSTHTSDFTGNMAHAVNYLVAAVKKAVHAMHQRCTYLHLSDPAITCKLCECLPNINYACKAWALNPEVGEKADLLLVLF